MRLAGAVRAPQDVPDRWNERNRCGTTSLFEARPHDRGSIALAVEEANDATVSEQRR